MKLIIILVLCSIVVEQNLASTFFGFPQQGKNGESYIQVDRHRLSAAVKYKAKFSYTNGCVLTINSGGPMEPYTGTHLCLPKPPKKHPKKETKEKATKKPSEKKPTTTAAKVNKSVTTQKKPIAPSPKIIQPKKVKTP